MGALRGWLLGVIAAAILTALADSVMPSGAVKRVGKLVCGLMLLAAVFSPLPGFEIRESAQWLEEYMLALDAQEGELERQRQRQLKEVMEEEFAAYISDKAAQIGAQCRVEVACEPAGDGVFLPVRAELTGTFPGGTRQELERLLRTELEIPAENQIYRTEEGSG